MIKELNFSNMIVLPRLLQNNKSEENVIYRSHWYCQPVNQVQEFKFSDFSLISDLFTSENYF